MNILIADDEFEAVSLLGETLIEDGHHVDIAADGKEALEYLQSKCYDIAILDHNMPEFTGLELIKYIKAHGLSAKIVIISGYPVFEEFLAKSLGADEVVMKPFNLNMIREVIARYLKPSP